MLRAREKTLEVKRSPLFWDKLRGDPRSRYVIYALDFLHDATTLPYQLWASLCKCVW